MNKREISDLFKKFNASISADDVWQVQQATVIKHKALERLGAAAGVVWAAPVLIRCERDEAVILVTGGIGERHEWSIGEALVNANYRVTGRQAPYVYAMAEKRAKDRVIIKLCGLHGIYSEDEADDFKQNAPAPVEAPLEPIPDTLAPLADATEGQLIAIGMVQDAISSLTTYDALVSWWKEKHPVIKQALPTDYYDAEIVERHIKPRVRLYVGKGG